MIWDAVGQSGTGGGNALMRVLIENIFLPVAIFMVLLVGLPFLPKS